MLSVYAQIKYVKSVWGVVKGFIEKNIWCGLEDFYKALLNALQSEYCLPPAKSKSRKNKRGAQPKSHANLFRLYNFSSTHSHSPTKSHCRRCTGQSKIRTNSDYECDIIGRNATVNNYQIDQSNYKIVQPSSGRTACNHITVQHFHGAFLNCYCCLNNCARIAKHLSDGKIVQTRNVRQHWIVNDLSVIVRRQRR